MKIVTKGETFPILKATYLELVALAASAAVLAFVILLIGGLLIKFSGIGTAELPIQVIFSGSKSTGLLILVILETMVAILILVQSVKKICNNHH